MGLTERTQGGQFTIIRIDGMKKEVNDPHFTKVVKNGDEYVSEGRFDKLSGFVNGISFKTINEGTDTERRVFELTIVDGEETFKLQSGFHSVSRNILNSLCGTPNLGRIEISLYKNGAGYPAVSIKNENEKTNWALSLDEQKELTLAIVHPKTGKVEKNDYTDLHERLELLAVGVLGNSSKDTAKTPTGASPDEDLPF